MKKTLLTILIGAGLLWAPMQPSRSQIGPACFALAISGTALFFVIYIHHKVECGVGVHYYVLEEKRGTNAWVCVSTNAITIPQDVFYAAFRVWNSTNGSPFLYRVKEIPCPWKGWKPEVDPYDRVQPILTPFPL